MKYLLAIIISLVCLESFAAGTAWQNYPTTNSMGGTDTLMTGNGATNLTITAANFNSSQTQPIVNTASNSLNTSINTTSNSLNTSINTSSNAVFGSALTQINTTSNVLHSQIGGGGGILLPPNATGVLTNSGSGDTNWSSAFTGAWVAAGTLPKTAADTTWAPVTNAVMITNFPVASRSGQVPRMTQGTNQFGAPTGVITNLLMGDLEYHVNTNAFTNIVIGTIGPLTNKDGLVFYIPIGTNAP